MRNISIVPLSKMEEMRRLLFDYLKEIPEFDYNIEFDESNKPIYKWFELYWSDRGRYPFFLIINNNIAGFALIRELANMSYEIAEFFLKEEFRKNNNALWFAKQLTNLFEGEFIFSTSLLNLRAIKFWDKFANDFQVKSIAETEKHKIWKIRENNFKNYSLHLQPRYFDLIKNGEKTLEGRLYKNEKREYKIGDILTFYKNDSEQYIKAIILDLYKFNDFDQMAENLNKVDLGFKNSSKEEMIETYRKIYSINDEKKFGVLVVKIKLI